MKTQQTNQQNQRIPMARNKLKVEIKDLVDIDKDWIKSIQEQNSQEKVQLISRLLSSCQEQIQLDIFQMKFIALAQPGKTKQIIISLIKAKRGQFHNKMYMTSKIAYKPSQKKQDRKYNNSLGQKQHISKNDKAVFSFLSSIFVSPFSKSSQPQKQIHPMLTSPNFSVQQRQNNIKKVQQSQDLQQDKQPQDSQQQMLQIDDIVEQNKSYKSIKANNLKQKES